jgi:hypothetical protein
MSLTPHFPLTSPADHTALIHSLSYLLSAARVGLSGFGDAPRLCDTIVCDFMDTRVITKRLMLVCLPLCLAFFGGAAESSAASDLGFFSAPQSSAGSGLTAPHFAIGDFDGDRKPDLATVQVDPYTQRVARYSIHLQLSLGSSAAIGFTAPFGGLLLSAKDVNGDSRLDLVVTTALDHQVVAVLVNDGHGNFTLAEQGAFPELTAESGCHLDAPSTPCTVPSSLLQSRCPLGEEGEDAAGFDSPVAAERFRFAERQNSSRWRVGATSGRSPPAACILP